VPDGPVLVMDLGAQYAQLIARRVREAQVYSEVVPQTTSVTEVIARDPSAVVLAGGLTGPPDSEVSVFVAELLRAGIPLLGIGRGHGLLAAALGGTVVDSTRTEPGRAELTVLGGGGVLHGDLPTRHPVWLGRDVGVSAVSAVPDGVACTAGAVGAPVAGFEDTARRVASVQYHPQVVDSPHGQEVLRRFLHDIAGIRPQWTTASIVAETVARVREQVGAGRAICALSGGVDSAVAAALVQRAIGERLSCVFVDHGLLRAGERTQVERDFVAATGVHLVTIDARERFAGALAGVTDPEEKRTIIGREFIRVFEQAQRELRAEGGAEYLVQGTLYPDVVESGGGDNGVTVKSHHNVGGLPDDVEFELVEPLRTLFKDEVRRVGTELGLPETIVHRQPFPGPGLGIRIVGEVTPERLDILRAADAIAREELTAAGLDSDIWQCPVVLLADVRSVGVQDEGRSYGYPVVLRPVSSEDAMTADWTRLPYGVLERISDRITEEVAEVNRVVLDVTSKPPGTIEWE